MFQTMHSDGRSECIVPRSRRGNSFVLCCHTVFGHFLLGGRAIWTSLCWDVFNSAYGWPQRLITSELDSYFVTKKMALDCMILFDLDFYFFNQYITGLVGKKGLQMHHASRWTLMPLRPRLIVFPTCVHTLTARFPQFRPLCLCARM